MRLFLRVNLLLRVNSFIIGGFATLDQTDKGRGIVVYIIEDIPLSCSKHLISMTTLNV